MLKTTLCAIFEHPDPILQKRPKFTLLWCIKIPQGVV